MLGVAVPNEITRGAVFADADLLLSSLAEQSLDVILRMVGRARAAGVRKR